MSAWRGPVWEIGDLKGPKCDVLAKPAARMGELEFVRPVFGDNASMMDRGLIERAIALRLKAVGVGGNGA